MDGMARRFDFQIVKTQTVIASEAKQSMHGYDSSGLLRRFAPRNDVEIQLHDLAACCARVLR
jgi:hypothetical protein